ncbi:MAG TPA: MerR family transcriptional regulator [Planctomycetota bacterium]|jgi:DNA-binding transcriptional MerR regulator|nr:MerR family transcriptional regulator [Planctomycetota bacterium]
MMGSPGEHLVRIGEFARLARTNHRTLRYYEELGLLRCTKRSRGGFRYYERSALERLGMIRQLQERGLPLSKIRETLERPRKGACDRGGMLHGVARALEEQRRLLRLQISRLGEEMKELDAALGQVEECRSCPMLPPLGDPYCSPCRVHGRDLPGPFRALLG